MTSTCDHIWVLGAKRFQCTRCRRYLNPWHVWAWERAKTRWWVWRDRVERMVHR